MTHTPLERIAAAIEALTAALDRNSAALDRHTAAIRDLSEPTYPKGGKAAERTGK